MKHPIRSLCRGLVAASLSLVAIGGLPATAEDREALEEPATLGVHHVGLAVTDLEASTAFFVEGLGWQLGGRDPAYPATFVSDGVVLVSLWEVKDPASAVPFDRRHNVGLHHLALEVSDIEALGRLHDKLAKMEGVRIEFGPEPNRGGPTIHMMVYEPSGNRIEFTVPGGRSLLRD